MNNPIPAPQGNPTPGAARDLPQSAAAALAETPSEDNKPKADEPPAPVRDPAVAAKHDPRSSNSPSMANDSQPATVASPVDDGLASQVAAIREARAAIRRGDGVSALAAIDRGLPQGKTGPLEQEATLVRVSALCLQGDTAAARRTAEQFLARFPNSLLASRIRSSCAFGPATTP